jgi:D-alanyl-D-alanine carboxypeptidase (penicillin-binding protein 5/6)
MFIMINDQVSVENLIKGIIIASGNDACVALAEGIAGSEENFVQLMNEKAVKLEWLILILQILLELMMLKIFYC